MFHIGYSSGYGPEVHWPSSVQFATQLFENLHKCGFDTVLADPNAGNSDTHPASLKNLFADNQLRWLVDLTDPVDKYLRAHGAARQHQLSLIEQQIAEIDASGAGNGFHIFTETGTQNQADLLQELWQELKAKFPNSPAEYWVGYNNDSLVLENPNAVKALNSLSYYGTTIKQDISYETAKRALIGLAGGTLPYVPTARARINFGLWAGLTQVPQYEKDRVLGNLALSFGAGAVFWWLNDHIENTFYDKALRERAQTIMNANKRMGSVGSVLSGLRYHGFIETKGNQHQIQVPGGFVQIDSPSDLILGTYTDIEAAEFGRIYISNTSETDTVDFRLVPAGVNLTEYHPLEHSWTTMQTNSIAPCEGILIQATTPPIQP